MAHHDPAATLPTWALDPEPPRLEGPLVRLRPLRESDRDAVLRVVADPEMVRWTTIPHPYPPDGFDDWLATSRQEWREATAALWAMADPADDGYLGAIHLRMDGTGGAEVGYSVAPWARGRGIATAAVRAACGWGFAAAGLRAVLWLAFAGNEASRRTARAAGFHVLDGVLRRGLPQRGERRDAWIGDLLPEDLLPGEGAT